MIYKINLLTHDLFSKSEVALAKRQRRGLGSLRVKLPHMTS